MAVTQQELANLALRFELQRRADFEAQGLDLIANPAYVGWTYAKPLSWLHATPQGKIEPIALAFVNVETGDIHKPLKNGKPAKTVIGNINDKELPNLS